MSGWSVRVAPEASCSTVVDIHQACRYVGVGGRVDRGAEVPGRSPPARWTGTRRAGVWVRATNCAPTGSRVTVVTRGGTRPFRWSSGVPLQNRRCANRPFSFGVTRAWQMPACTSPTRAALAAVLGQLTCPAPCGERLVSECSEGRTRPAPRVRLRRVGHGRVDTRSPDRPNR